MGSGTSRVGSEHEIQLPHERLEDDPVTYDSDSAMLRMPSIPHDTANRTQSAKRITQVARYEAIIVRAGREERRVLKRSELFEYYGLTQRDVRGIHLDARNMGAPLIARDRAVLLKLVPWVCAVVCTDTVAIIMPTNHTARATSIDQLISAPLIAQLVACTAEGSGATDPEDTAPFEVRALEVLLSHVLETITTDHRRAASQFKALSRKATASFETRRWKLDRHDLLQTHILKSKLARLHVRVDTLQRNIHDVITDERDLAMMCFTRRATRHAGSSSGSESGGRGDEEEMESMLEFFHYLLLDQFRAIDSMEKGLEHLEAVLSVNLDVVRNDLIRMEMLLTIGTFAAAACAIPTGIFGMNLTSGIEDHGTAFHVVVSFVCAMFVVQFLVLFLWGRRNGIL